MKIGTLFYCICFLFNSIASSQVEKNHVFMIEPGLNVVSNSYKEEDLFFRKAPGFEISLRYQQYKEKKLGIGFTAHTYFNHNKPSIENLLLFTLSDDTVIVHGNYWSAGASAGIMPFIQLDKHLIYILYESTIGAIHYPNEFFIDNKDAINASTINYFEAILPSIGGGAILGYRYQFSKKYEFGFQIGIRSEFSWERRLVIYDYGSVIFELPYLWDDGNIHYFIKSTFGFNANKQELTSDF